MRLTLVAMAASIALAGALPATAPAASCGLSGGTGDLLPDYRCGAEKTVAGTTTAVDCRQETAPYAPEYSVTSGCAVTVGTTTVTIDRCTDTRTSADAYRESVTCTTGAGHLVYRCTSSSVAYYGYDFSGDRHCRIAIGGVAYDCVEHATGSEHSYTGRGRCIASATAGKVTLSAGCGDAYAGGMDGSTYTDACPVAVAVGPTAVTCSADPPVSPDVLYAPGTIPTLDQHTDTPACGRG